MPEQIDEVDAKRRHCIWPARSRFVFAIFLILAGTLLFLSNIGILPVKNVWNYWPVILVMLGIGRWLGSNAPGARMFGSVLIVLGALFLMFSLGLIHVRAKDPSWPLSLLFIAFGVALLYRVLDSSPMSFSMRLRPRMRASENVNVLNDIAIFGALKRRVDADEFVGGELLSVLGEIQIDLRHVRVADPSRPVLIEANAIFGAIKLKVPESWRVNVSAGVSLFGAYQDKTIPPNTSSEAPTLIVSGNAAFGAVEIED